MKILFISILVMLGNVLFAQGLPEIPTDPKDGCPIFEMHTADTVYIMKQYYMVFYKSGPNRDQSEEEAAKIQEGHMAHINKLGEEEYLTMAGPFGDDTELRGILIFNVPTKEQVEELMKGDPAVQSGRLIYEIHPWWGAKGTILK